jgi:hypothetical protein
MYKDTGCTKNILIIPNAISVGKYIEVAKLKYPQNAPKIPKKALKYPKKIGTESTYATH